MAITKKPWTWRGRGCKVRMRRATRTSPTPSASFIGNSTSTTARYKHSDPWSRKFLKTPPIACTLPMHSWLKAIKAGPEHNWKQPASEIPRRMRRARSRRCWPASDNKLPVEQGHALRHSSGSFLQLPGHGPAPPAFALNTSNLVYFHHFEGEESCE